MVFRRLASTLAIVAAMALPAVAQTPLIPIPLIPAASGQTASQFVAARIYRALVGREAEPDVMAQAAADIEQGRMRQRVNAIVISSDFRSHTYGLAPDKILAQIYQGLLDHDPDPSAAGWQRMIAMSKYADVIAGIIATPEFQAKLAARSAPEKAAPGAPGA